MFDFNRAIAAIKEIRGEYPQLAINGDERPIDLHFLLMAAENYTGLSIRTITVPVAGKQIRSQLRRFGNRADIIYSDKQNFCWTRYSVTKEISHLLFDVDGCFVGSVEQSNALIEKLIFPDKIKPGEVGDDYYSEKFTEYCALELLFPIEERGYYIDQLAKGETGHYQIANQYKVPQRLVEIILTPNTHKALLSLFASS